MELNNVKLYFYIRTLNPLLSVFIPVSCYVCFATFLPIFLTNICFILRIDQMIRGGILCTLLLEHSNIYERK